MGIDLKRAKELLDGIRGRRLLVIGDLMLDRYIYGDVDRISPEAPVPVVKVEKEVEAPGGSSNVALNVHSLKAKAEVCGLCGRSAPGEALVQQLREQGIGTDGLVIDDRIVTTVKTRIIAARQQVVRVDHENPRAVVDECLPPLIDNIAKAARKADGLIIEDYGKGAVQQAVVDAALSAARSRGLPIGFDPKDNHTLNVHGITFATPNRREAFLAAGMRDEHPEMPPLDNPALLELGRTLLKQWGTDFMLITLGPQGMLLVQDGVDERHVPTRAQEVFDVSGAGDTVIAVCTAALAAGASPYEAAELANEAAGVVVGKLGTAVCTAEEILNSIQRGRSS